MNRLLRPVLIGVLAALALAGCADKPVRPAPTAHPVTTSTAPRSPHAAATPSTAAASSTRTHRDTGAAPADDQATTGIPACDDYLASYRACHQVAKVYAPDQIESRYQMMRKSLLDDSRNPSIRPQLSERCNALASSLRQALHGQSCAADVVGDSTR